MMTDAGWLILISVVPAALIYCAGVWIIYRTIGADRNEWRKTAFEAQVNAQAAIDWGTAMQRDKSIAQADLKQASFMLHTVVATQNINCTECYKAIVSNGPVIELIIRRRAGKDQVVCTECAGDTSDLGVYRSWPRF